jgi:hypothetical protein
MALDTSTHPPAVSGLRYALDGWLGNVILTRFPCSIMTTSAAAALRAAGQVAYGVPRQRSRPAMNLTGMGFRPPQAAAFESMRYGAYDFSPSAPLHGRFLADK